VGGEGIKDEASCLTLYEELLVQAQGHEVRRCLRGGEGASEAEVENDRDAVGIDERFRGKADSAGLREIQWEAMTERGHCSPSQLTVDVRERLVSEVVAPERAPGCLPPRRLYCAFRRLSCRVEHVGVREAVSQERIRRLLELLGEDVQDGLHVDERDADLSELDSRVLLLFW